MRYDQIRPGTYPGTATGSALGKAGTGNEQLGVSFDVHLEDPDTGQPCSVPMMWFGHFSEKSLGITDKALSAMGFDMGARDIAELNPEDPGTSPIVGAEVNLVLEQEEGQDGNPKLKIRWVNRRGGGIQMKERLGATEAAAFGANLRKRILTTRGPGAAKAPPPAKPAARAPATRKPVPVPPVNENTWDDEIPQ